MTPDEYCISVCGAKCCRNRTTGRNCPNLADDKRCRIYAERFKPGAASLQIVGQFTHQGNWHDLKCMSIVDALQAGIIAPEIAAQCCYQNPNLLEIDYAETNR